MEEMNSFIIDTPELQLTQMEFLIRLLVAIGIGLLLGLEREHAALLKKEQIFAGIRTFTLLTLVGFIGASLHYLVAPWIFSVLLISVIIITAISYWITAHKGDIGSTSELTAIIAVLLGGLTFLGYIEISLIITVIVLVMLSSKIQLQAVIGEITQEEMYAFVRFVVIALLIFPFLPDETYGPRDVFNPKEVGWVIILTSGLGFVGYVLMRILGASKGILISGILGGLVSSTLVTWVFSKKSKEEPAISSVFATAILAACVVMVVRVYIWVAIFNPTLIPRLILALGVMFLGAAGATIFLYLQGKNKKTNASIPLGKPLDLKTGLLFGLLFVVITFIMTYATEFLGQGGSYLTSALAGMTDLDAITISISKLSKSSIEPHVAQNSILVATLSNTVIKFAVALWLGSKEFRKYVIIGYGAIFLSALLGFIILNV